MARIVEDSYIQELKKVAETHYWESENGKAQMAEGIAEELEKMPEVVRCKECKYSRTTQWYRSSLKCCHKSHGNSQVPYEVPKEHFCSYGERKDNG